MRKLVVEFTKMSGAGNDFIVIDNRFYNFTPSECAVMVPRICKRRSGIGADGLLLFEIPRDNEADCRMVYYNGDGTEGTMCGNGARCLARYAVDSGFSPGKLHIETASGIYTATVSENPEDEVKIAMNSPRRWQSPLFLSSSLPDEVISTHYLWPGTEHVVVIVPEVSAIDVQYWGKLIRNDSALSPSGANVNFVQIKGSDIISVRTYEKGVEGETLACGTGAVASATTAVRSGLCSPPVIKVNMPGGVLQVGTTDPLYLQGPTETVYRGSFEY